MPRKSEEQHVETTPHLDGNRDTIIQNSTGNGKIGLVNDRQEELALEEAPYKFTPKPDRMMERFEKLMKGEKKET